MPVREGHWVVMGIAYPFSIFYNNLRVYTEEAKCMSGNNVQITSNTVINKNISSNILRSKFYVCPVCNNIIRTVGDAVISCCGITLPPLDAEDTDAEHQITIQKVEDEHFITVDHDMTKEHYISFIAYLTSDRVQFVKFYPEGNAETRFNLRGCGVLYIYCNKHGLMKHKILREKLI